MKIRVLRADPKVWYSDLIGEIFHVFQMQGFPDNNLWLTVNFFFYPQDVEIVRDGEGNVAVLNFIGLA
jgi:hypothetical protein